MKRKWEEVAIDRTMPTTFETVDGGQLAIVFSIGMRWHWLTRADNGLNAYEGSSTTKERAMSAAERAMTSPSSVKPSSDKPTYHCPFIPPRGAKKSDPADAHLFESFRATAAAHEAAWHARYSPQPAC